MIPRIGPKSRVLPAWLYWGHAMRYELPQVATLRDALLVPGFVADGATTGDEIAQRLRMVPRQGGYRLQAARLLGLIAPVSGSFPREYRVTPLGAAYLAAPAAERPAMSAQILLSYPGCVALLNLASRKRIGITAPEAIDAFQHLDTTTPALSTLEWRVPSLLGWLVTAGLLEQDGTRYRLTTMGESAAFLQGSIPAEKPARGDAIGIADAKKRVVQDAERRARIENAAIDAVTDWYTEAGRRVKSRERENVGWDLDVSGASLPSLKVEVKGTSQQIAVVELTVHEYSVFKDNIRDYRVAIVTSALTRPDVREFYYDLNAEAWTNVSGWVLKHQEVVALRLSDKQST